MVDDNKEGSRRLLQDENRVFLNRLLQLRGSADALIRACDGSSSPPLQVRVKPIIVYDLACFRHCEHLANSGFCGCPREVLLTVLKAPANEAELRSFLD
eukprot:4848722-Pleurochrysis_carterae.AAC.1